MRIRNRCEVTGRPRGYYRKLKLSRIALRDWPPGRSPAWSSRAGKESADDDDRSAGRYADPHPQRPDAQEQVEGLDAGLEAARARARRAAAEGYIRGYRRVDDDNGRSEFEIELKYYDGEPVIREIERVSKPGRRVYASVKDLPRVANGLGVSILSTPKGVMSDAEARDQNVGGEVLCRVF